MMSKWKWRLIQAMTHNTLLGGQLGQSCKTKQKESLKNMKFAKAHMQACRCTNFKYNRINSKKKLVGIDFSCRMERSAKVGQK